MHDQLTSLGGLSATSHYKTGVLRSRLHLSFDVQGVSKGALQWYCKCYLNSYKFNERWIICTTLSVNIGVTLAREQHLEYNYKALFLKHPALPMGVTLNRNYLR
jgi:hypothetical protein